MSSSDIVAIITAAAAAVVSILTAWRTSNVRQQLQQHVQLRHGGVRPPAPPSSQ